MFGKTMNDQFIMGMAKKAGTRGRDVAGALGFIDQTKG